MSIKQFINKYPSNGKKISKISASWLNQSKVDDFLGLPIFGSIVVGDYLNDGALIDNIPSDILTAMKQLMPNKINNGFDARNYLIEKLNEGDRNIGGAISNIQGRIGEFHFQENFGKFAELAKSNNQQHWDVKVNLPGEPTKYVQVKVYDSSSKAYTKLKELDDALSKGEVFDQTDNVTNMEFAVNQEIYEDLKERANLLGTDIKVVPIGKSHAEINSHITDTVSDQTNLFDDFFEDLLGGFVTGAALHLGVNGYLLCRGSKGIEQALEDTIYSTIISTGGMTASLGTRLIATEFIAIEALATTLAGPVGLGIALGVGVGTRSILKRVSERRFFSARLKDDNEILKNRIDKLIVNDLTKAS